MGNGLVESGVDVILTDLPFYNRIVQKQTIGLPAGQAKSCQLVGGRLNIDIDLVASTTLERGDTRGQGTGAQLRFQYA